MRRLLVIVSIVMFLVAACSRSEQAADAPEIRGWDGEVIDEANNGAIDLASPKAETDGSLPFADAQTTSPDTTEVSASQGWIHPDFIFDIQLEGRTDYRPEPLHVMNLDAPPPENCVGPLDVQEMRRAEPLQTRWTATYTNGERVRIEAASIGADGGELASRIYRLALTCQADDLLRFEAVTRSIPATGPIEVYTMQRSETSGALWGTTFHRRNISVIVVVASALNEIDATLFDSMVDEAARALDEAEYEQRLYAFNVN